MAFLTSAMSVVGMLLILLHSAQSEDTCPQTALGSVVAQQNDKLMAILDRLLSSENHIKYLKSLVNSAQKTLQTFKTMLWSTQEDVEELRSTGLGGQATGSVYIRWGRNVCPRNSTLVYSGLAGGKHYYEKGSGNNRLCLSPSPKYDSLPTPAASGRVYGAEYEHIDSGMQDRKVPCALCHTTHSAVFMLPGSLNCPKGWSVEYRGHLAAEFHDHYSSDYVCLDKNPNQVPSSKVDNKDGLLFYYVIGMCGSLPCPPYKGNQVLTCVVCSK